MVEIVPLEGPVTLRRQFRLRNASEDANLLRQQFAETQVQISGNVAAVEARVEDHERLLQLMQDRTTRLPQNTTKQKLTQVYTLRVQDQPVGNVLRQLAQRLNWATNKPFVPRASRWISESVSQWRTLDRRSC